MIRALRLRCARRALRGGLSLRADSITGIRRSRAIDTSVIALWLGHERIETTRVYLHADLALKERALARTTPPNNTPGRYRPPDPILAYLESL